METAQSLSILKFIFGLKKTDIYKNMDPLMDQVHGIPLWTTYNILEARVLSQSSTFCAFLSCFSPLFCTFLISRLKITLKQLFTEGKGKVSA